MGEGGWRRGPAQFNDAHTAYLAGPQSAAKHEQAGAFPVIGALVSADGGQRARHNHGQRQEEEGDEQPACFDRP